MGIRLFLLLAVLCSAVAAQEQPQVDYIFEPCLSDREGSPSAHVDVQVACVMRIRPVPGAPFEGVQGWSMSVAASGVEVTEASTDGTVASSVDSDPPGLQNSGFEKTELARVGRNECEGRPGAVSAVVLSFVMPIVLKEGDHQILTMTVRAEYPEDPNTVMPAFLGFVDGCEGSG